MSTPRPQADLAQTLAQIVTADRVVDLTLALDETLPCTWPGHMPYRATTWTWFTDRPDDPQPVHSSPGGDYQTRWLVMDEHTGTHLDAPRHFVPPPGSGLLHAGAPGDVGIADLPLLAAAGPAAVFDVSTSHPGSEPGHSPAILPRDIERWESEHGRLDGEVVLFHGGWDRHYRPASDGASYAADVVVTGTASGWPAPTTETIALLRARSVTCIGTDAPSMGAAENGAPAHLAGLPHGMVYVEGLTRLDQLPPRGGWFLFLPIKLVGGTGGPGRAIAVRPDPV